MCIIHLLIKTTRCSLHRLIQTEILRTHSLAIFSQESGDTITLVIAGLALGNRASCSIETRARITRRCCGSKNDGHLLTKQEDVDKWEIPLVSCWLGSHCHVQPSWMADIRPFCGMRVNEATLTLIGSTIYALQQDKAGMYTNSKSFPHYVTPAQRC